MMARSSRNEPMRAVSESAAIGPACTARATPKSNPSTCHPPPTVYASPAVSALPCPASGVDKPTRAVNIVSMDRRTFVLLTGATSGALIRPPVRQSHSPTGAVRRSGGPAHAAGLRHADPLSGSVSADGEGRALPPAAARGGAGGGRIARCTRKRRALGGPEPGGHAGDARSGRACEPCRDWAHPGTARPRDRVRRGRAGGGPSAAVAGRARGGEQLAPDKATAPRRRRVAHAPVLRSGGRRPGCAAGAVRALLACRSGAPRRGGGAHRLVYAGRVARHRS